MNKEGDKQPITLEQAIASIESLSEEYRLDTEMSSDRARLYMGWLDETAETVKSLSPKWNPAVKIAFANTAENLLNSRYFKYGTEYGTGYGTRPMVEITRSLKHFFYLPEEETIAYLNLLGAIYRDRPTVLDPLNFYGYVGSSKDKQFRPLVQKLNDRLKTATDSSTIRKREIDIVSSFVTASLKAKDRKIPGFKFWSADYILRLAEIPYRDSSSESLAPILKIDLICLKTLFDCLTPQVREDLVAELEGKAESIKANDSDFETPGLSETMLNNELAALWRDVEKVFYQTLAENL